MDLAVTSASFQTENRSWLRGTHGTEMAAGITVDASLFVAATHFPNGYLPSGTVLSAAGGPYSGTGPAAGILFSSLTLKTVTSKASGAVIRHGFVNEAKLPFATGTGSLGASGKASLPLIDFS